jgi:hypothetical protein
LRALALIFNEVQYRSWGEMLQTIRTGAPAFEREACPSLSTTPKTPRLTRSSMKR